jgi:hypothetical protein
MIYHSGSQPNTDLVPSLLWCGDNGIQVTCHRFRQEPNVATLVD